MTFRQRIGSHLITLWAVLIFSHLVMMGPVQTFAFGLFCFSYLFFDLVRRRNETRSQSWAVRSTFIFIAIIWFLINLIIEVPLEKESAIALQESVIPGQFTSFYDYFYLAAQVLLLPVAFLFPLLDQFYFYSEAELNLKRSPRFKYFYYVLIAGSFGGFLFSFYMAFRWFKGLEFPAGLYFAGLELTDSTVVSLLIIIFCILFILNYLIGMIGSEQPFWGWRQEGPFFLGLHIRFIVALLFSFLLYQSLADFGNNQVMSSPLVRFLPLIFLFLNIYSEQKSTFFDLFVKRATFFYLSLICVMLYFVVYGHYSRIIDNEHIFFRVAALVWLPFFLLAPWFYKLIDLFLDRFWLGRKLSAESAMRRFMEVLHFETRPDEVLKKVSLLLGEVFNSRAYVTIIPASPGEVPDNGSGLVIENRLEDMEVLRLHMDARPSGVPYYEKDKILLRGLLGIAGYYLKLIRLQEDRRMREIREQELLLDASQSRLKALRAQINPHFLFNALNAIASFTKTDPARAEKTVELLSEVFRYTLQYSEREWVRLEDELDFISAYLEVEEARFGDRLSADISMEVETGSFLIPSMVVQTLVENAVKHGISGVKSKGKIKITTVTDGTKLWITVWDNGPGFEIGKESSKKNSTSAGVGLENIRNRLNGYFGEQAELSFNSVEIGTEAQLMIPVVEQVKQLQK